MHDVLALGAGKCACRLGMLAVGGITSGADSAPVAGCAGVSPGATSGRRCRRGVGSSAAAVIGAARMAANAKTVLMGRYTPSRAPRVNRPGLAAPIMPRFARRECGWDTMGNGVAPRASLSDLAERHGVPARSAARWRSATPATSPRSASASTPREVSEWFPVGTRVSLALTDPRSGTAMEVIGDVVREVAGTSPALGVLLIEPPPEWRALVANAARQSRHRSRSRQAHARARRRRRSSPARRDGALRLERLGRPVRERRLRGRTRRSSNIELDAVIAELDAADPRVEPIMDDVRKAQPTARRIVRGAGRSDSELVHRYVDRDSGLEALLDAITANITPPA